MHYLYTMKSFKISNLVTKILFSVKTRKLIHTGYKIRAGGSEIFSKKKKNNNNKQRMGGTFIRDLRVQTRYGR